MGWKKSDRRELHEFAIRNARRKRLSKAVADCRDSLYAAALSDILGLPPPGGAQSSGSASNRKRQHHDAPEAPVASIVSEAPSPTKRFRSPAGKLQNVAAAAGPRLLAWTAAAENTPPNFQLQLDSDFSPLHLLSEISLQAVRTEGDVTAAEKEEYENISIHGHFVSYLDSFQVALASSTTAARIASSFAACVLANQGVQGYEIQTLPLHVLVELVGGLPRTRDVLASRGPLRGKRRKRIGPVRKSGDFHRPAVVSELGDFRHELVTVDQDERELLGNDDDVFDPADNDDISEDEFLDWCLEPDTDFEPDTFDAEDEGDLIDRQHH